MLDFIQYINDNWNVSAAKKTAMLSDFCAQYGYKEEDEEGNPNPVTKKEFANEKIIIYFKESVNAHRKRVAEEAAEYTELDDDFV